MSRACSEQPGAGMVGTWRRYGRNPAWETPLLSQCCFACPQSVPRRNESNMGAPPHLFPTGCYARQRRQLDVRDRLGVMGGTWNFHAVCIPHSEPFCAPCSAGCDMKGEETPLGFIPFPQQESARAQQIDGTRALPRGARSHDVRKSHCHENLNRKARSTLLCTNKESTPKTTRSTSPCCKREMRALQCFYLVSTSVSTLFNCKLLLSLDDRQSRAFAWIACKIKKTKRSHTGSVPCSHVCPSELPQCLWSSLHFSVLGNFTLLRSLATNYCYRTTAVFLFKHSVLAASGSRRQKLPAPHRVG